MGKKIQRIGRYTLDGVTLGWGNFAKVDLATHEITRVKVAIKIIDTKKVKDEYVRANLHREARIMSCLKHPHIIRLYETLKATTLYCLVTEYITGGDLLEHIKTHENQRLDENSSRAFIRQLLSALAYLHERGIVHRDLKMENVLLDEKKKNIKIIDFGLSNVCKKHSLLRTHCGSPEYAAPELFIAGKTYGPEIDIWSLGVITYAMTLGKLPFSALSSDDYQKHKMLQQIQKGLSPAHEKDMQVLSASCRNLLHQLIEPQPQLRIPLQEIEKHSWITKNGKHPFFRFTAYPKSVVLRNQVIGELSYLSEIKKGILSEMVRENKSDEISAMYNMMLDQKKRELGYFAVDHTRRCQVRSTEKTSTPESCKTTSTLSRKVRPKKGVARTEFLPRRANEARRHASSSSSFKREEPFSANHLDETAPLQAAPNDACNLIFLSQPYFQHLQPRNPNCTPPLKLSMTLDLSVANLSSTADQIYHQPPTNERHNYDSLHGVAASSGVPPRMSPKEETKPLARKPKRSTTCSISFRKKLIFPCGMGSRDTITEGGSRQNNAAALCHGRNLCRPTTLFLKMRSKKSCLLPKSCDLLGKKSNFDKVVAPRASPESSFIEVSSSNCSMNEDDTSKYDSNSNIPSSTPTNGRENSREETARDGSLQIARKINVFFSQRISMSLDCLMPALRRSIHANQSNKIASSQAKETGKIVFSNHTEVPSNQIEFAARKSDSRKFLNLHSKYPDASLGSSSSPSFPTKEMFGSEEGGGTPWKVLTSPER